MGDWKSVDNLGRASSFLIKHQAKKTEIKTVENVGIKTMGYHIDVGIVGIN